MMRVAFIIMFGLVAFAPITHGDEGGRKHTDHAPGEVLVLFKAETQVNRIEAIAAELGIRIKKQLGLPGYYLFSVLDNTPIDVIIKRVKCYQEIEKAEPNYISYPDNNP